jgi:hypothetical protein
MGTPRTEPLKIKRFQVANFKRLSLVDITPQGDTVVLAGENEQGKSSVLDAIEWILRGKIAQPEQAVHRGKKKARGVMCLSDLAGNPVIFIEREATTNGGASVKVRWADEESETKAPQSLLDTFYSLVAMEPMKLGDMAASNPRKFADELRKLTGADTTAIDQQIARIEVQRTDASRELKSAKARADKAPTPNTFSPPHPDAPAEEVSVTELAGELERANEANRENERAHEAYNLADDAVTDATVAVERQQQQIEQFREQLRRAELEIERLRSVRQAAVDFRESQLEVCRGMQHFDVAPLRAKLEAADATNRKVRENAYARREHARLDAERAELRDEVEQRQTQYDKLDAQVGAAREKRLATIAAAKMPIPGLSFAEDGSVTYKDLPLEQASQAERYHVLTAICAAQNPQLRVILLRNAALLGPKYRQLFAELARDLKCQLWEEHVDTSIPGAVILEDGRIAKKVPDTEPPPPLPGKHEPRRPDGTVMTSDTEPAPEA